MGGKSDKGNRLEHSESQRLETLAGIDGLLALVQTTRLTGGCDFSFGSVSKPKNENVGSFSGSRGAHGARGIVEVDGMWYNECYAD